MAAGAPSRPPRPPFRERVVQFHGLKAAGLTGEPLHSQTSGLPSGPRFTFLTLNHTLAPAGFSSSPGSKAPCSCWKGFLCGENAFHLWSRQVSEWPSDFPEGAQLGARGRGRPGRRFFHRLHVLIHFLPRSRPVAAPRLSRLHFGRRKTDSAWELWAG